ARSVDGDRLLGEDMLASFDGRSKVLRTEMRRRAEQDDINAAGKKLLVSVETNEAAVRLDVHLTAHVVVRLEMRQALLKTVLESVRHRHELDIGIGREGLHRGSRAALAAADKAHAEQIATGRVDIRDRCQCPGDGGRLKELTTRGSKRRDHDAFSL